MPNPFPPFLKPGDRIRVIAPSGALIDPTALEPGIEIWQAKGYDLILTPGFDQQWGYLAGTDQSRCQQLISALKDPDCVAILCARGGYGGARLLESLATEIDPNHPEPPILVGISPKWLIGFSDITALLWGLHDRGIQGVHAPVLTTLAEEPPWTIARLFNWLEGQTKLEPLQGEAWGGGQTTGKLMPANLTVATHLLNTDWQPDLTGAILAFEDVSEAPYRLDRLLTYWRMGGFLTKVNGIALGRFSQCHPPANRPSFTVEEVLRDRLGDLKIPIVSNLPFGHDGANAALPVGIPAYLDGDRGLLEFPAI